MRASKWVAHTCCKYVQTLHSRDSIDHRLTVCCEKAEIYQFLIYPLLVCVSLCIYLHFRKRIAVSLKILKRCSLAFPINQYKEKNVGISHIHRYFMYICDGTSMCKGSEKGWITVEYPIPRHEISQVPIHWHPTPTSDHFVVLPRLDPSIVQRDSNS